MSETTIVAAGTVVTDGVRVVADVLIRDGSIAAIGAFGERADHVIRADGCMVTPGGVDAHTHVFGAPDTDGVAALCGGTTSALSFVDALPGEGLREAAQRGCEEQVPRSPIDLGLHGVVWEPAAYRPGDLAELADLGVTSVKLWLAYEELGIMADDGVAYEIMSEAAREGLLVMAHCENGPLVSALVRQMRREGRTTLAEHGRGRPIALEAEAVHRFLRIAGLAGADTYVVHVSGREPLEEIVRARARGQRVLAEVCPHHLLLDDGVYDGNDALRYMMTPPLRGTAERSALWQALTDGALDVCASDHSHVMMDPHKLAAADDVTAVPYGVPGIQWRMPLLIGLGVEPGLVSPERLVEVACSSPARAFGLYPQKGTLLPGADADVVIWDPRQHTTVGADTRRDGVDYSPYDGFDLAGGPRYVLAGGELVVSEGEYLGRRRPARFLTRPRRRREPGAATTPAPMWG